MSSTRVKICGLTRRGDVLEVAGAGADYVGVVSVRESPRFRTPRQARILADGVGIPLVIVLADRTLEECVEAGSGADAGVIQLHGQESPEQVKQLAEEGPWDVWKALRIREAEDLSRGLDRYGEQASGLLLDGWHPHRRGGTGVPFSWKEVAAFRDAVPRGILFGIAGGLSPENVSEALDALRPDLVDVSSGVEESPGNKSHALIREFVLQVRSAGGGVIQ